MAQVGSILSGHRSSAELALGQYLEGTPPRESGAAVQRQARVSCLDNPTGVAVSQLHRDGKKIKHEK